MKPEGVPVTGCKVEGCESRLRGGLGYCSRHYQQVKKHGGVREFVVTAPDVDRFWHKVDQSDQNACWNWQAKIEVTGYGRFWFEGKEHSAHRIAYELTLGPIPDGLVVDHACNNRRCVNPEHLRVMTPRDNVLRGSAPSALNARKTHCKWGHEFTADNVYSPRGRPGHRHCRKCLAYRDAQRRQRRLLAK